MNRRTNPVTRAMIKFTRMLVVPDKKKAEKKGYVKHKGKINGTTSSG
jgi:hypothetical protein